MKLHELEKNARKEIEETATSEELEKVRIRYLGRKGKLTEILHSIGNLSKEEKPVVGRVANRLKIELDQLILIRKKNLEESRTLGLEDLSLPGRKPTIGNLHPLTILSEEIINIFISMGFSVVEGPEIETDYYNFTALNTPPEHPARDLHDTFYLKDGRLLRTHTSPVQIRIMEKHSPPLRIISPGRCYRVDTFDPSHSPTFMQIEGLWVDKDVSMADLFGTLKIFARKTFGGDTKVEFLPGYFPFTEPSAELWIQCPFCTGKGCSVCHQGNIEILGCGMVHPNVLKNMGYSEFLGFAFGMGVERIAMIKYNINDIRLFYQNDLQFLKQFNESKL
jgi:phenylalanyl-tRNA synthetase alpha chain